MSETVTIEAIKTFPAILWVAFAVLVFLALRPAILPQIRRLSSVKTPVFEASFAEKLLDEATTNADMGPPPSASERRAAVSRLEHAAEILADGRILWVDDNPHWNSALASLFRQLKMVVDTPRSTEEALALLRRRSYDLIITDMRRETEQPSLSAGVTLLDALARQGVRLPVIVFSAGFDPTQGVHPRIFAYTNRGDDLVHYVIDLMERAKFGAIV
jgi:CheY-like chemotaxis protein